MSKMAWQTDEHVAVKPGTDNHVYYLTVEAAQRLQYDLRHAIEQVEDAPFEKWWATLQQANGTCGLMKLVAPGIAMSKEQAYPVWKAARRGL